jgi:hypothetical protein
MSDALQNANESGTQDIVIVCMPSRGQVCYETMLALQHNLQDVHHWVATIGRKPVVEARNALARYALALPNQAQLPIAPREWFVLWADDDSWWPAGAVGNMVRVMKQNPDVDAIFGKFGSRTAFGPVIALREASDGSSFPKENVDCRYGDMVEIKRAGFHWVLMRLSLLERVGPDPFNIPPGIIMSEDFAFCDRACAAGAKLVVATGCPVVHIEAKTGLAYLPGMPAMLMDENTVREISLGKSDTAASSRSKRRLYGDEIDLILDKKERNGSDWADRIKRERGIAAKAQ